MKGPRGVFVVEILFGRQQLRQHFFRIRVPALAVECHHQMIGYFTVLGFAAWARFRRESAPLLSFNCHLVQASVLSIAADPARFSPRARNR